MFGFVRRWLAMAGAFGIVALAALLKGMSMAKAKQRAADDREYRETRQKLDSSKPFDSAEDAADWARNRFGDD